jgi:thioesterase domain-containing protein
VNDRRRDKGNGPRRGIAARRELGFEPFEDWASSTLQPLVAEEVPGNHFSMMKPPHLDTLARRLHQLLAAASPQTSSQGRMP